LIVNSVTFCLLLHLKVKANNKPLQKGCEMSCNVGKTDRIIRIILGLAILAAGFYFQTVVGGVGLILLATAVLGWCPLYRLFGLSTCQAQS
jgi:hypothetical protein